MRDRFRIYSDILQLRSTAFVALKFADDGMHYAVSMFIVVGLIAGSGVWIGLPALIQRPVMTERIDQISALVDRLDQEIVPQINASLDAISQENLSIALADLIPREGVVSTEALAEIVNRAGLSLSQIGDALASEAAGLSQDARTELRVQIENLLSESGVSDTVTPEQIDRLLEQTTLNADQVTDLLSQTSAAREQVDQMRTLATQQGLQLEELLAQIPFSYGQIQSLFARLALAPERLSDLTIQLGLTPGQIARLRTNIDAFPDEIRALLETLRASVERVQPPLGTRFSRFIRMLGGWISTPFQIMADWALFGLMLLVVAKLLGGTGTLRQHVTGLLLIGAPFFLLFFTYVPNVAPAMPLSFNFAFDYFGRILAVVAIVWAGVILIKSMSITHEFGMWRAAGAVGTHLAGHLCCGSSPLVVGNRLHPARLSHLKAGYPRRAGDRL